MNFEVYTWIEGKAPRLKGHALLTDDGFFSDVPQAGLWLQHNALPVIASVGVQQYLDGRVNRQDAPYHLKKVPGPALDNLRAAGYSHSQSRLYAFDGDYWHALADVSDMPRAEDLPAISDEHTSASAYLAHPGALPEPMQDWQPFTGSIFKHLPRDFVALEDPLPRPY